MKAYLILAIFVSGLSSAWADPVLTVNANTGWQNIPYCEGRVRLICEKQAECNIEFERTRCVQMKLYTNSTFYPSNWTILQTTKRNGVTQLKVDSSRLSGFEAPYFYSFIHTEGNGSYAKIKFQMPAKDRK